MVTGDDINALQKEGKSESEIRTTLLQRGASAQEVGDAFTRMQIKGAVASTPMSAAGAAPGTSQGLGLMARADSIASPTVPSTTFGSGLATSTMAGEPFGIPQPRMPSGSAGFIAPVLAEMQGQPLQSSGALAVEAAPSSLPAGFEGMQPSMLAQDMSSAGVAPLPSGTGGQTSASLSSLQQIGVPQQSTSVSQQLPGSLSQMSMQGYEQVGMQGYGGQTNGQAYDYGQYPTYDTAGSYGAADAGQYSESSYGGDYQPYQEGMSSDVISEVAEQVVSERLSYLQEKLEKALDMRTVFETRIVSIDERLKKIEAVIDRLQLSVLQRVGEYTEDVRDIKHELIETQKSFGSLLPQLRETALAKPVAGSAFGGVPVSGQNERRAGRDEQPQIDPNVKQMKSGAFIP